MVTFFHEISIYVEAKFLCKSVLHKSAEKCHLGHKISARQHNNEVYNYLCSHAYSVLGSDITAEEEIIILLCSLFSVCPLLYVCGVLSCFAAINVFDLI